MCPPDPAHQLDRLPSSMAPCMWAPSEPGWALAEAPGLGSALELHAVCRGLALLSGPATPRGWGLGLAAFLGCCHYRLFQLPWGYQSKRVPGMAVF